MSEPQPTAGRRRLQALRAIPDSQRTEAQWDELNELEIAFAPVNRVNAPPAKATAPGGSGRSRRPRARQRPAAS